MIEKHTKLETTVEAFNRIKEIFESFPTKYDKQVSESFRELRLEDNDSTVIQIKNMDKEKYFVTIYSGKKEHDIFIKVVDFSLSEKGLIGIRFNSLNFEIGDCVTSLDSIISINYTRGDSRLDFEKWKSFSEQSGVLVDWLQQVVDTKKYTPPPITITI